MKKITMLILFIVCTIGYGQNDAKSLGSNQPINYQQQKRQDVLSSNRSGKLSDISSNRQEGNNAIFQKKQQVAFQFISDGRSATFLEGISPVKKNISERPSMSPSNISWRTVIGPPPGTASRNMMSDSYYDNMAPVIITHSVTQNIVAANSVTCNAGGIPDENSFFRDFNLAADFGITDAFNVSSAEFAVEAVSGPTNLTINIYSTTTTFPGGYPGSATLQGTA